MHWVPAYVGIGSNLDGPFERVRSAFAALRHLPQTLLIRESRLYRSLPMGPVVQDEFCNAVAGLLTRLPLRTFFSELRQLEQRLGRQPPRERWGPRHIDLDLLLFDDQRVSEPELTLPHPGIMQRNFVLYPLADVAADLQLGGAGRVRDLVEAVSGEGIWRHEH